MSRWGSRSTVQRRLLDVFVVQDYSSHSPPVTRAGCFNSDFFAYLPAKTQYYGTRYRQPGGFLLPRYLSCDQIERSIERSWARAGCAVWVAGGTVEPSFSSPPSGRLTAYLSTRRSQAALTAMYASTA